MVKISEHQVSKALLASIFKINKLIEVELEIPGEEESKREFVPLRVEGITPNSILVSAPKHNSALLLLRIGESVPVRVYRFGALYSCEVRVCGRQKTPFPILLLSFPHTIEKTQLRNWVRVKVDIPVYYRMAGYPVDYYWAVGCDISGGGICILTSHFIDIDTRLEMKLIFPEFRIEVIGQVRRCWMDKKTDAYKTGIKFEKIEEKSQEELVAFIFLKQREIIQKGITDSE